MTASTTAIPEARALTTAPLRLRFRATLNATVAEVWALVGDLSRMPEYSAGLERVDLKKNAAGVPTQYVCHFKPMEPGGAIVTHAEPIRWYQPNLGWASTGSDQPDEFGMSNALHLVTVQPAPRGSQVSWVIHFNAEDLNMARTHLDEALSDITQRLISRFGGRLEERFVDGGRA